MTSRKDIAWPPMADPAVEMVREFIRVLDEAKEAANRSVLSGTISCRICRALVLNENSDDHYAWHRNEAEADMR